MVARCLKLSTDIVVANPKEHGFGIVFPIFASDETRV